MFISHIHDIGILSLSPIYTRLITCIVAYCVYLPHSRYWHFVFVSYIYKVDNLYSGILCLSPTFTILAFCLCLLYIYKVDNLYSGVLCLSPTFTILAFCLCLLYIRGLLEKYPTFDREKETGLLGALDT